MATLKFETVECDRCGGTGRMPYAAYNGVCFKCNGGGKCYTAAGKRARKRWEDLTYRAMPRKAIADVVVGDRVLQHNRKYLTVASIDKWTTSTGSVQWTLVGPNGYAVGYMADATVQVFDQDVQDAGKVAIRRLRTGITFQD